MSKRDLKIFYYLDDIPTDIDFGLLICIDTERMGLNNYRDRVCLIQIYDVWNHSAYIVKVTRREMLRKGLIRLLDGPSWKLFHYALGDVVPLNILLNISIRNVLCTKLLAKISSSFTKSFGLKSLINRFCRRELPYYATTYWGGHLSPEQLEYALNDVIYLHIIYLKLLQITCLEGRQRFFYIATHTVSHLAALEAGHWDYVKLFSWESVV